MKSSDESRETVFDHILYLSQKIGPRPAGSQAELNAAAYISETLLSTGCQPRQQTVSFAQPDRWAILIMAGAVWIILSACLILVFPWPALFAPLFIPGLPEIGRWLLPRVNRNSQSVNIYAKNSADPDHPTLLLCAHMDSAPARKSKNNILVRLHQKMFFINQRVAIAMAALVCLSLLGYPLPALFITIVQTSGIISGGIWLAFELYEYFPPAVSFSPGAFDNASGVALILAVARHFSQHPLKNLNLGFLFTGAEDPGLYGAWSFLENVSITNTCVINIDMIGAGNRLCFVSGDGFFRRRATSPKLNRVFREIEPGIVPVWNLLRSGDYYPFLQKKIPVASLQTEGYTPADLAYHSTGDTVDIIQTETLNKTLSFLTAVIAALENNPLDLTGE